MRAIFLSPPVILVAGAAIAVSAMLAVEAVRSFTSVPPVTAAMTHPVVRAHQPAVQPAQDAQAPGNTGTSDEKTVAAGPATRSSETTGGAGGEENAEPAGMSAQIKFFPPEPAGSPGADQDQMQVRQHVDDPASPASSPHSQPERMQPVAAQSDRPTELAVSAAPATPVDRAASADRRAVPSIRVGNDKVEGGAPSVGHGAAGDNRAGSDDMEAIHRRQSAQAAHNLETSQLVHRISGAIRSDNHALTAELITKLEKAIGSDHVFVQKLNAFWEIRKGRLDEARTLLQNVLSRQPADRESGVNMAVIDIRSGRFDDARRRLELLHEAYPEDGTITTYLRQLSH